MIPWSQLILFQSSTRLYYCFYGLLVLALPSATHYKLKPSWKGSQGHPFPIQFSKSCFEDQSGLDYRLIYQARHFPLCRHFQTRSISQATEPGQWNNGTGRKCEEKKLQLTLRFSGPERCCLSMQMVADCPRDSNPSCNGRQDLSRTENDRQPDRMTKRMF